jgi:hypothetical protein
MKKNIIIVLFYFIFLTPSLSETIGEGELKLTDRKIKYFKKYLSGKGNTKPGTFLITTDGSYATFWYCPVAQCAVGNEKIYIKKCEISAGNGKKCKVFARTRYIKWKNGINPGKGKASKISSKLSFEDLKLKLTELGFVDNKLSLSSNKKTDTTKQKKESKKIVKKYELKGERSIALSWDGYDSLIAGTVNFDESDYKGNIDLPLPNNDGICEGTYSLQAGGKGTWQIACTNNMGAAGTLKWIKEGGVTGIGRDHNDKKVKFTVSKKS